MKGRMIVFLLIIITLIALVLCWYWLQDVIVDYDLERAMQLIWTSETLSL
ncbi:MAG: hypothetical protein ACQEWU_14280 [Bacillota bacterium]|nr:hypothetical protein [Virgibacillus sp. AGTR]MCC2251824.1 hypothetical protein [Virgibacillus sp. AGTR]QRZ16304.1 hypothetical protein JUJ52_10705 [Virgibacillus sp. AGTR]